MEIEFKPLYEYGLEPAVELLNRGFADYLVKIELTPAAFLHMARVSSLDLLASRVCLRRGEGVGVALIARRGWSSRLAGMAMVPEARGSGLGTQFVNQLLADAEARGERAMVLEVIEQNEPAVRLYRKCGFRTLRRLIGYTAAPAAAPDGGPLEEVDLREAAGAVTAFGLPDLPWQISGESLAQAGPPSRAFRRQAAYAAISDPDAAQVAIRALVVKPEGRRQGQAGALLRAVMARYPGKTWQMPAVCPEEIGGVFEKNGFAPDELTQFQMLADWT